MSHVSKFVNGLVAMTDFLKKSAVLPAERMTPVMLPSSVVSNIFEKYRDAVFMDSKMIVKKYKGSKVKYSFHCSHYANGIFYRCQNYYCDDHLHCGRCGMLLKNNIKLKKTLHNNLTACTIYDCRRKCGHLSENIAFYSNFQEKSNNKKPDYIMTFWENVL